MRIPAAVLIVVVALADLVSGLLYLLGGSLTTGAAHIAEEASRSAWLGTAEPARSETALPSGTNLEELSAAMQTTGGVLLGYSLFLLFLSGLAVAACVVLLRRRAPGFVTAVGVLQIAAEVASVLLWQAVGVTNLFAAGVALFVVVASRALLKSRTPRASEPAVAIATPGDDGVPRPCVLATSARGKPDAFSRTTQVGREIRGLLEAGDPDRAYALYAAETERNQACEFDQALEVDLAERLLLGRNFERAGKILERSVAAHPARAVSPRVYFNLGYIHVMTRRLYKARRFFRLFLQSSSHPVAAARTRRILSRIEDLCAGRGVSRRDVSLTLG